MRRQAGRANARLEAGEAVYSVLGDRACIPPFGVGGAGPASPVRVARLSAGEEFAFATPGKVTGHRIVADDIVLMKAALRQIGIPLEERDGICEVTGAAGPLVLSAIEHHLDLGLAGTAIRPLTAALTLGSGTEEPFFSQRENTQRYNTVARFAQPDDWRNTDVLRIIWSNACFVDVESPLRVAGTRSPSMIAST